MAFEIPNRFAPAEAEPALFARWEKSGAFQPDRSRNADGKGGRFVVMIPPPNVTGSLHMGHALNNTVQDVMVRFHRKGGKETLWVPGTDHAGIATQAVIEKKLFKEKGITREQLGREKFLAEVWAWKEQYGSRILEQLKRMGCSCDFTRTKFTMDEDLSAAVREAFTRLWEKGLIYRGPRLVNWDCVLQTAVGDDEINHETRKSKLWHLKYPIEGKPGEHVIVATTRPETMLGDTGVVVNPDDPRWKAFIGKRALLPLLNRPIPILADPTVDAAFGTGAVKVTPGHDPNDYERGQRFKLPVVSIFSDTGRINAEGGPYAGLSREEGRKRIVADLEAQGLLDKVVDHESSVAISDRSGSVIEPRISEQWFVKMAELAQPAIAAVKPRPEGGAPPLRFVPERWTKVYLDWLENVRDWCISRQLWWGHRVPVWYDADGVGIASRTEMKIGEKHPKTGKPIVRQDDDVLDTWASSWLWPMATLGWPKQTDDLARYYPTQFLSTAREIIYLWVARMVMAGYEFADWLPRDQRCPFAVCYLNATVLDQQGRRMSKSLGNGIDPVDMIDKYGADAMRLSLMLLTVEGQDIRFSEQRVEEARNFVNKLWNATRFVLQKVPAERLDVDLSTATRLEDRWILARLRETLATVTDAIPACRFHEASHALRKFAWNDFCDWYVEIVKVRLEPPAESSKTPDAESSRRMAAKIAVTVIEKLLQMLHPMAPYVTEALWSHLKSAGFVPKDAPDLIVAPWPRLDELPAASPAGDAARAAMDALQALVSSLRKLRQDNGVAESATVSAHVKLPDPRLAGPIGEAKPWFERLARCTLAGFSTSESRPADSVVEVVPMPPFGVAELYVPLRGLVDFEARRKDLHSRREKLIQQADSIRAKLANEGFVSRAPAEVVARERERLAQLEDEIRKIDEALRGLSG